MELFDIAVTLLGSEQGTLFEKIVLGVVAYFLARREVRKQFGALNTQLGKIEIALKEFGEKIADLEKKHESRISRIEAFIGIDKKQD